MIFLIFLGLSLCTLQGVMCQKEVKLQMPGVVPSKDDYYSCVSFEVSKLLQDQEKGYITKFSPIAEANIVHHMLLSTCNQPLKRNGQPWECMMIHVCRDHNDIVYGWAKNAKSLTLPDDVSITLDPKNRNKFLVLQVHYAHKTSEDTSGLQLSIQNDPTKFEANILFLLADGLLLPPDTKVFHADANCIVKSEIHFYCFQGSFT